MSVIPPMAGHPPVSATILIAVTRGITGEIPAVMVVTVTPSTIHCRIPARNLRHLNAVPSIVLPVMSMISGEKGTISVAEMVLSSKTRTVDEVDAIVYVTVILTDYRSDGTGICHLLPKGETGNYIVC